MNHQETEDIDSKICTALGKFPDVRLLLAFGSVAAGKATPESDLDIAMLANGPITVDMKIEIIRALADSVGRPVDLVDLSQVGEPLLGQILQHGRKLFGDNQSYAKLLSQHLIDQSDFVPYQSRILRERREAWIGR